MSALMLSLKKWSGIAMPKPDIALIAALIAVLAMMVLPMPTFLLDILIGINLSFALVLLIVALHLASPLQIRDFACAINAFASFNSTALAVRSTCLTPLSVMGF